MENYIKNITKRIISEEIDNRIFDIENKIFENKNMKKQVCSECGGKMYEGECMECGGMYEGDIQELGGMDDSHPFFGGKNLRDIPKKDIERFFKNREEDEDYKDRSMYDPYYGDDDEEEYYPELRMPRDMPSYKTKYRHSDDEEQLYEVEFDKEMEEGETEEGNAFTGALADAKKKGDDEFEVDGKKYNVKESILFTENDLIDLIEKIVKEEKSNIKVSEPKGYAEYEKAHKADKKENEAYLKSVAKKMEDYLKGASDKFSKYEMKETKKFPTENGGMNAKRKKYTPSEAVDEYIEAFSYPGQTNLVYDEIKPSDKKIEGQLKGSSTNGNAQVDKDGKALGNVVPSEVGERFYKNFKDNLYGQEQMSASYKRQPQPVDQAGEDTERGSLKSKKGKKTSQSVLNKLEESTEKVVDKKLNEEYNRIQQLMGYNRKTQ
jgi:hypothetical protein